MGGPGLDQPRVAPSQDRPTHRAGNGHERKRPPDRADEQVVEKREHCGCHHSGRGAGVYNPGIYDFKGTYYDQADVLTNAGSARAFRAPSARISSAAACRSAY